MRTLRIAMAQMNPTVGDLTGTSTVSRPGSENAKKAKADLVVFPELAITGYPPEDLLLKSQFVADNVRVSERDRPSLSREVAVVGYVGQGDQSDSQFLPAIDVSAGRGARALQCGSIDCRSQA